MNGTIELTKMETHAIIEKVIGQLKYLKGGAVEETCPIGIISMENWEWPQGVGLFSLYLYYRKTTRQDIKQYLVDWFDRRIAEGLPAKNVNTMCPMLTLSFLAEETGRADYMALCREWAEYAVKEMPRTEEGGIQHVVSGHLNEGEVWDDTLYMTVLFVCRMGLLLNEESFIDESVYQFLIHIKYLTDRRTGLLFHGWTFNGRHHFAEALWARGNSWYTAGLVDYLEMVELPKSVERHLLSALEQQAAKLAELQAADGMWHTLLDDPNSYTETSATAAFAYGILKAVRKGYLPESYREVGMKAWNAVVSNIDADGVVQGVSYGTGMGRTLQEYRDIPICPMPYGQSMTLLMLTEGLEH